MDRQSCGKEPRAFLDLLQRSTAVFRVVVIWDGASMLSYHNEIALELSAKTLLACTVNVGLLVSDHAIMAKQGY